MLFIILSLLPVREAIVNAIPKSLKLAISAGIGLFLGIAWLAGEGTLGRFAEADADAPNRLAYYRTTWEAIGDRPLLGTGYGTYADAFRAYNHPGTGTYFLDKAHNTYLQMITELGWPAAAALYASLGLLVFGCLRDPRRRVRDPVYPAVLAACSGLVAVHSLVDFSLEMPANAATYALLLGVGCARSSRASGRRRPVARDRRPNPAAATEVVA